MSYSVSYSTDLGNSMAAQSSAGNEPLYALGDLEFLSATAQATLLLNRRTGAQELITRDVANALSHCARFDTLRAHVQSIVTAIPELAPQRDVVLQTLSQLAEGGYLVSADEECARINKRQEHDGRARTRAFIITCDRPAAVEKLLESLVDIPGISRHEQFFLVDMSRQPENVLANSEILAHFNTRSAQSIVHISPQRQNEICAALVSALPQHENAIQFLFDQQPQDRPNYGAARNFCLLLSAGRRAVVLDDDILAFRLRAPEPLSGFAFAGGVDSDIRFFHSMDAVLGSIDAMEESAIDGAAACLGLPLSAVPAELGAEQFSAGDLRGTPGVISAMLDGDSPVLVTQCGTLGDPGTSGLGWLHMLNSSSRASLQQALQSTGGDRIERCCWRGAQRTTIAKMASMSQLTGLDNSRLLPPYFPYFRGEDLAFGAAVDFVHPRAAVLEYNWCVAHLPEQRRAPLDLASDPISPAGSLGMIARKISDAIDPRTTASPQARLLELAALLDAATARSDHDLALEYRSTRLQSSIGQLELAVSQLQQLPAGSDDGWKRFVDRSIEEIRAELLRPWRPADLLGGADDQADARALGSLRSMMGAYAGGLQAWADIRAYAEDTLVTGAGAL